MEMQFQKKKKDFKIREDIVLEFERLAPGGKQTAIVEHLLSQWIVGQNKKERAEETARAYGRERKKK